MKQHVRTTGHTSLRHGKGTGITKCLVQVALRGDEAHLPRLRSVCESATDGGRQIQSDYVLMCRGANNAGKVSATLCSVTLSTHIKEGKKGVIS